jgi:hypothetical protein
MFRAIQVLELFEIQVVQGIHFHFDPPEKDIEAIEERTLTALQINTLSYFSQTADEGEKQEPAPFHQLLLDR